MRLGRVFQIGCILWPEMSFPSTPLTVKTLRFYGTSTPYREACNYECAKMDVTLQSLRTLRLQGKGICKQLTR